MGQQLLLGVPLHGHRLANSRTRLHLVAGVRGAGGGSSSRLPSELDGLGARDGRVGEDNLVNGGGVGGALLGAGIHYDNTLCLLLLLRLLVVSGERRRRYARLGRCWFRGDVLKRDA